MVIYGYAKSYMYTGSGEFNIQVRIPNIHGPYDKREYKGHTARGYVEDANLPWYPSLILPHTPKTGDVVALMATNSANSDFLVIGLTGGQYTPNGIH